MKIEKTTLEEMRTRINDQAARLGGWDKLVETYESGNFARSELVKDLQRRFCFDMYYNTPGLNAVICMMPGIDDNHIYTALKAVCPKVVRRY